MFPHLSIAARANPFRLSVTTDNNEQMTGTGTGLTSDAALAPGGIMGNCHIFCPVISMLINISLFKLQNLLIAVQWPQNLTLSTALL